MNLQRLDEFGVLGVAPMMYQASVAHPSLNLVTEGLEVEGHVIGIYPIGHPRLNENLKFWEKSYKKDTL